MGLRRSDNPERRKLAIIRAADTETATTHSIGGIRKSDQRPKPSLPKMPWDDARRAQSEDASRKRGE